MRFKKYINNITTGIESYINESLETDIQKVVDKISKDNKIQSVKVRFSNKQLSGGDAYYQSSHLKGTKNYKPINITIGEWDSIKEYPGEWQHRLAHEIAHHILAQTQSTLRHSKKHDKLTSNIENQLRKFIKVKPKLSSKEVKRIKDKLDYWLDPDNKMELIDYHGQKTYDNQIKSWQDKLK